MRDIILVGGGGHCKSVVDTIKCMNDYNIIGILDIKEKVGTKVNDVEIIGTDDDIEYYYKQGIKYSFITLGSIGNTNPRQNLYERLLKVGYNFPAIVDKTSLISSNAMIGDGAFIGKGTIINSDVIIGENCIINSGAIIEHDCCIGKFSHIAPGSTISGNVMIGDHTHIGANSTIIQNINIGKFCIIGAGSVVVSNINDNMKAYGNPCREVND
jgi:sugar O-acyltransferase (sialic acid O-acetyltransferase NeuD family)